MFLKHRVNVSVKKEDICINIGLERQTISISHTRTWGIYTNTLIWTRLVLPTALYSCEVWDHLSAPEIELLERTQWYAVRYIQCMDKYSHTDSTTSNLGICNIEAVKFKLLFVGELCRSKTTTTHTKLLNNMYQPDNHGRHLWKFINIWSHNNTGQIQLVLLFGNEHQWRFYPRKTTMVKISPSVNWRGRVMVFNATFNNSPVLSWRSIGIHEEIKCKHNVEDRCELSYGTQKLHSTLCEHRLIHSTLCEHRLIHSTLCEHRLIHSTLCELRLIRLTMIYQDAKFELLVLVVLGSTAIKKAVCSLCHKPSNDIVKHWIMEWQY
jgi:hypothetical protein